MKLEVTQPPQCTIQYGDIVVLHNEACLVILPDKDKYNLINLNNGNIVFLHNYSLVDFTQLLKEKNALIYSSDDYKLILQRREDSWL